MDTSKSSLISASKQIASKTASNLIFFRKSFGSSDLEDVKEFKGFEEDDPLLVACKQKRRLVHEHLKILRSNLREKSHPYHHQQQQRQTNACSSTINENQKKNSISPVDEISSVHHDEDDDIDDIDEGDENNLKEKFQGFFHNDPMKLSLLKKKKTIEEEKDKLLKIHVNNNSVHYRPPPQQQNPSLCNGTNLRESEDEIVDKITQRLNTSNHNNSSNNTNSNTGVVEQQLDVSSFLEKSSSSTSSSSTSLSNNNSIMMTQDIDISNNDDQHELQPSNFEMVTQEMETSSEEAMTQLLDISDHTPSIEISEEPATTSSSSNKLLADDSSKDDIENEFDSDISSVKKQMKRLLPHDQGNFVAVKGPRVKQVSHSSGYMKKLPIAKFGDNLDMPSRDDEDCMKYVEGREETTYEDVDDEESDEENDELAKEEAFMKCPRQNGTTGLDHVANIKCFTSPLSMEDIAISGFPVIAKSPFVPPKPSCFLCGSSSTEILIFCSVCCEPYHPYCCGDESLNQWCRTSVKIEKTEMMRKEKTISSEKTQESDEKKNDLLISPSLPSPPLTPVLSDLDLNFVQLQEQFLTWTCKRCLICQECGQNRKPKQSSTNSNKSKSSIKDECEFIKCAHCRGAYHIACLGKRLECGLVEDFEPSCSMTATSSTIAPMMSSLSSPLINIDPKKNWNCPNCTKCRSCGVQIENNGISEKKSKKSKGNSLMLCKECFSQRQKGSFCPLCNVSYDDDDYDTRMMECASCERWIHAKCEEISEEQYQVLSHLPESIEFICKLCCDTTKRPAWYRAVVMDIVNGCESVLNVFTKKAVVEIRKCRALDFDALPSIQEDVNSLENQPKNTKNVSPITNLSSDNNTDKYNTSRNIKVNVSESKSSTDVVLLTTSTEKCPSDFSMVIKKDEELLLNIENTTDNNKTIELSKSNIVTPPKNNDDNNKIEKVKEKVATEKDDQISSPTTLKLTSAIPEITSKLSRKNKRKSDLVTRLGLRTRTLECRTKSFTSNDNSKNKKVNNLVEVYELSDGSFVDVKNCQVGLTDILKYPPNDEISNVLLKAVQRKNSCITSTAVKEEENNEQQEFVVCKMEEEDGQDDNNYYCSRNNNNTVQLLSLVDEKKNIEKIEQEDMDILLKHDLDDARTKWIELTPKKKLSASNTQETKTPINTTPRALFTPSKKVACFVDLVKSRVNIGSLLSVLYFKEASLDILEEYYTDVDVTRLEKLKDQFNDSIKEVFTWFDEVMIKRSDLIVHQTFVKSSNGLSGEDGAEKKYELNPFQDVFWDGLISDNRICSFCGDNGDYPEDGRGRLLWAGLTEWIHINCVLWSSEVWENEDGALQEVSRALNRSKTISCAYCQKKGASLTCCHTQCRNTYHFHCALLADCVLQLDKTIFCPKHPKEQFEEDSIQYEYQVYRKVFVDLEWLKKKEKPACSSEVKVFIGSLRIENLGQIIPLSVINNLSIRCERNENNENMETLLISNNYKAKRFFWSNQNPFEKVQYEISATVKKDWFRSFAKRKLPTEVNIVIDHSKNKKIVQKKMNNMKSFHNWVNSIPKMIDEYNVEWIPACPLLFSSDDEDDEENKQIEIDLKSEILENEDEEICENLNLSDPVYWTNEDILKNHYDEEEEELDSTIFESVVHENEDSDKPPIGCILNFNLDMDDQLSNFDDLDMLESPPGKITNHTTTTTNSTPTTYIHADSKDIKGNNNDENKGQNKRRRKIINDQLDKEKEGSIDPSMSSNNNTDSQIKTRRKTRSMTLFKYAMLDGAANDSSSEASFSSASSSSDDDDDDEEEEDETEQTTESSSSSSTGDDLKLPKKAKKSSPKGRTSNITGRGRQKNSSEQRVTRNRSQVLAHSRKSKVSSPTKTIESPGRRLRNRDNLQQKKEDKTLGSSTEIECPSCEKPFSSQSSLNRHSRWCKPQKKTPAAVKRTSSASTVDSSSSNGPSTSKRILGKRGSKLSSKSLKMDEDDDDADYQIEEDEEEEEEEDDSLSSEPTLTKTKKNPQKKRRIIESEDSNSCDTPDTQVTTRTASKIIEKKEEQEHVQQDTTDSKALLEKTMSLNDDDDKPKTCSKCKLTYRTLASFNKHLPNCVAYSSSDDDDDGEEKTNDDYLQTMNDPMKSVQATSTSPKNHQNQQESNNSSTGNTSPINASQQCSLPTCESDESSNSSSNSSSNNNQFIDPLTEISPKIPLLEPSNSTEHECTIGGEINQNDNNMLDQTPTEKMETSCSISTLELNEQQKQEQISDSSIIVGINNNGNNDDECFNHSPNSNVNNITLNENHSFISDMKEKSFSTTSTISEQTLKELIYPAKIFKHGDTEIPSSYVSLLQLPANKSSESSAINNTDMSIVNVKTCEIPVAVSKCPMQEDWTISQIQSSSSNTSSFTTSEPLKIENQQQPMYSYVTSSKIPQSSVTQSINVPISSGLEETPSQVSYSIPMQNVMLHYQQQQQNVKPFSSFVPQEQQQQIVGVSTDSNTISYNQNMEQTSSQTINSHLQTLQQQNVFDSSKTVQDAINFQSFQSTQQQQQQPPAMQIMSCNNQEQYNNYFQNLQLQNSSIPISSIQQEQQQKSQPSQLNAHQLQQLQQQLQFHQQLQTQQQQQQQQLQETMHIQNIPNQFASPIIEQQPQFSHGSNMISYSTNLGNTINTSNLNHPENMQFINSTQFNNNNNNVNNGNSISGNIGANTNVTYLVVQQGNTISTIPVNSSSLNAATSIPFQVSPSITPGRGGGQQQEIISFAEQPIQQQQQMLNPHSVINPIFTRNLNNNNNNNSNVISPSSNLEFQHVPNSFNHCGNAVSHQILVPGQNQQLNNNNSSIMNSSDPILSNTNKILTGNTFLTRDHVEMELPWKIIPQSSSSSSKKRPNVPARTGVQLLLPKILPAIKTSPQKVLDYNDITGSLTQGISSNDQAHIHINGSSGTTVPTIIHFPSETNLHANTNLNIISSTAVTSSSSSGKAPISSPNIAVVRPLEHPLQKISQQISQLSMNFNNNNNSNNTLIATPSTTNQEQQIFEEIGTGYNATNTTVIHPSQVNEVRVDSNYNATNSLNKGTISSNNNVEKQALQHEQTSSGLTTTTGKMSVVEEKNVNLSTCMNDNIHTSSNSKQGKILSNNAAVDTINPLNQQHKTGESSKQENKSIKVVLRSKKDGVSMVEDINKSELKTVGAMRSLKIKGKITSGEHAGTSTDVVIVPIVKTIPAISKFIIDENNEPKFELVGDTSDDDDEEDLDILATSVIKPFNVPKRPHRAVIVYEVKCNNAVLLRSSDVRAVWQHVFTTVQGKRLENNLPPLAYPATNISLPDNKQEAASSCDMLGLTHQAVQFLLEQLPGKNSVLEKHKFRFHDPKDDEPLLLPVNESGCARTEAFSYQKRKPFDIFGWLSSKFREVPPNIDISTVDSTLSSPDLPVAMRFRNLQARASKSLVVRYSPIHGRGLYTRRHYTEGEMIIEYAGELIRTILSDKREREYESKGIGCYFFTIDELVICDATLKGNQARFINHSCDPNCRSKIVEILGKKHILIFAIRKIQAGEELTYDYKFAIESHEKKIKCTCGTKKCRKYLN